jgi:hypothetical protein
VPFTNPTLKLALDRLIGWGLLRAEAMQLSALNSYVLADSVQGVNGRSKSVDEVAQFSVRTGSDEPSCQSMSSICSITRAFDKLEVILA